MRYRRSVRRVTVASTVALASALVVGLVSACAYDWNIGDGATTGDVGSGDAGPEDISCEQGKPCRCPPGGAACSLSCTGGSCTMACGASSSCDLSCTGGSCKIDCGDAGTCATECVGGGCEVACNAAGACTIPTCLGTACPCSGKGCR